jgi:hypothetical protein
MKVLFARLLTVSVCCLLCGPIAQSETTISGKVTDDHGKPVPNVEVILEYAPCGVLLPPPGYTVERVTRTSATGEYKFSGKGGPLNQELGFGGYRLRFRVASRREIIKTTHLGLCVSGPEGVPVYTQEVDAQVTPVPKPSPTPRKEPTPKATPTPNATPGVTPSPSPEVPVPEIDRILKRLDWGNIAFNMPDSMSLEEAKKVELLLGASHPPEELKKQIEGKSIEGNIKIEKIQISEQMEAQLTGDGFNITRVTPERRAVSKAGITEWKWDVRAVQPGKLRLHLILNALVKIEGLEQPYTIRTFDKEYFVDVPWRNRPFFAFLERNWPWLWTTILIPTAAWLWNRKRKKGKKIGFL